MTRTVRIGKAEGKDVLLDLDEFIHGLATGSTGSGKSSLVRRVLEVTHGIVQQFVIDYEGEFATLREAYDYVLVGKDGDVPVNPRAAALLVRRAMERGFSVIVDLSESPVPQRHEFVKAAAEAFLELPRELWHDVLLVIDEAHLFAPEVEKKKRPSPAKDAIIDVAARGRKRGVHLLLATQRLAKLDKDVAAECQDKLVGRTNLSDDRKRAVEELAVSKSSKTDLVHDVARLDAGAFYVVGPGTSPEVALVRIDRAKTNPPPRGAAAVRAPPPRGVILRVLEDLKDLPQAAEAEARSLDEARRRITKLEQELQRLRGGAPAGVSEADVQRRLAAAEAAVEARFGEWSRAWDAYARGMRSSWEGAKADALRRVEEALSSTTLPPPPGASDVPPRTRAVAPVRAAAPPPPRPRAEPSASGKRSRAERILDTLATLELVPGLDVTTQSLAGVFGVHPRGGSYLQELKTLEDEGLITRDGTRVRSTPSGVARANPGPPPASAADFMDRTGLGSRTRRVFDAILGLGGEATKEDIAGVLGVHPRGGSFLQEFSRLTDRGLVQDLGKGRVRVADWIRALEASP